MVHDQGPQNLWSYVWCFSSTKTKNKPLTVVGDGKQKRDFTYISDVIQAL